MFLFLALIGVSASGSSSQPDGGNLVCSYTQPQDMSTVETLYSHTNGVLRARYCTTVAPDSPQLLTSGGGRMLQDFQCDNHVALPYLPGAGYNILTGMPIPNSENAVDPGYLDAPVFERTWEDCKKTHVQPNSGYDTWVVPDACTVVLDNFFLEGRASTEIHDQKSFQKEAMSNLVISSSGSGFGVDMEFTAGSQWSSATESFSEGKTVEQRYTRKAGGYTTTLVPADSHLDSAYLTTLANAFVKSQWESFFLIYGTHVTTNVRLGARYSQVSMFKRHLFEELQNNQQAYNLGIKASYDRYTGAVDLDDVETQEAYEMISSYTYDQYIVSSGGSGATIKDSTTQEYQAAAHNFPSPLGAELVPHDHLITVEKWQEFFNTLKAEFPNDHKAQTATETEFKEAWKDATELYCGDEAHKCQSVTESPAPLAAKMTPMRYESPVYGEYQSGGKVVSWDDFDLFAMNSMIRISAIRTFCGKVSYDRYRFRGLQFEYFDGSEERQKSDILGTKGDSDLSSGGKKWDSEDNTLKFGEFISTVEVSSGADIDGIWFTIQDQSSNTREIGCGYNSPNMQTWNLNRDSDADGDSVKETDQKLLAFSGTSIQMDDFTIVKQIQFGSYLFIYPTTEDAADAKCKCVTPNEGTNNLNGAECTDGTFLWCDLGEYCTDIDPTPKNEFKAAKCKEEADDADASFFATPVPPPAAAAKEQEHAAYPYRHHEVLLQQIEQLKKAAQASPKEAVKESNEAAAKKDSKHFNWKKATHQAKHEVKELSKKLKDEVKEELKDFILKEMKTALGDVQSKQTRLANTVTRMLEHQIERL